MFTVCPKCALTLVVTAADLRVAQGYVRCGRCSSVFNALARLTDDRQAAESLSAVQQPAVARAESGRAVEPTESPAHLEAHGEESQDEESQDEASHAEASYYEARRSAEDVSAKPEAPAAKDHGAPPVSTADSSAEPPGSAPGSSPEEGISESALEFDPVTTDVAAVFIEPPPDPAWTEATGTFKAMIAHAHSTTPESSQEGSSLESSSFEGGSVEGGSVESSLTEPSRSVAAQPQPGVSGPAGEPEPSASAQLRPSLPARSAPARGPEAARTARPRSSPRQTHERPPAVAAAARRTTPSDPGHEPDLAAAVNLIDESAHGEGHAGTRVRASVWGVAAGIASLVLLAQIVHHHRDELAVRAGLNRPLTALYAALGMPLVPRWDVRAYDVRQLGAVAGPATAGLITVRASIKNAARQAQPLPLLRVTLQDRFGNRVASRDVAPRAYLPHAVPAASFLGAGQRVDAEMGFVDPGANAVGFEIDACLPERGGGISCANDSATR
jgi:predicted Zn finger-like uncharacterized protein